MDLKQRARALLRDVPAVYLALGRPDTPLRAKLLAACTVAYALSPIDLIPDFIPVLGYLDDVLLLPALVALTLRCIPPPVLAACRRQAEGVWAAGRPKRWPCALPVLLVWGVLLLLLARWLLGMAGK